MSVSIPTQTPLLSHVSLKKNVLQDQDSKTDTKTYTKIETKTETKTKTKTKTSQDRDQILLK